MKLKEILVYRGDEKRFQKFDHRFIGRSTGIDTVGFWFSNSKDAAEFFGPHVRAFNITMNNPLVVTSQQFIDAYPRGPAYFARLAKKSGYDGLVIQDIIDGDKESTVYCVFDASQITPVKTSSNS